MASAAVEESEGNNPLQKTKDSPADGVSTGSVSEATPTSGKSESGGWRAKLYKLNNVGQWDDMGTGYVTSKYQEKWGSIGLFVHPEAADGKEDATGTPLLASKIVEDDVYQRHGDTIITWTEPDAGGGNGVDLALSFQEEEGCVEIWSQLCSGQGKFSGEYKEDGESSSEAANGGQGEGSTPVELPDLTATTLGEVAQALADVQPLQRKSMVDLLIADDAAYIRKLLQIFGDLDDLEDEEGLKKVFEILKGIIFLRDPCLLEVLLRDDMYLDVFGICEYDPDMTVRAKHREYLKERANFREVVEVTDELVLAKIHLNFRLSLLKDVVLRRALDDGVFCTMNSLLLVNNMDIVCSLTSNDDYMQRLGSALRCKTSREDALGLVKELCSLARNLNPEDRDEVYYRLFEQAPTLRVIVDTLAEYDAETTGLSKSDVSCIEPPPSDEESGGTTKNVGVDSVAEDRNGGRKLCASVVCRRYCLEILISAALHNPGMLRSEIIRQGKASTKKEVIEQEKKVREGKSGEEKETSPRKQDSGPDDSLKSEADDALSDSRKCPLVCAGHPKPPPQSAASGIRVPPRTGSEESGGWTEGELQASSLLFQIIRRLTSESDIGVITHAAELLRLLLDTESMQLSHKDEFLGALYDHFIYWIITPLQNLVNVTTSIASNKGSSEEESILSQRAHVNKLAGEQNADQTSTNPSGSDGKEVEGNKTSKFHVVELLTFCTGSHGYHVKYFILRNNIVSKVLRLVNFEEKHLQLAAIRFVRACVGRKEDFYNRYLVKNDLFKPVMAVFMKNKDKDNLVNSAVIELVEFIRSNSIKILITYLVENYADDFKDIKYVPTFSMLMTKYEQLSETRNEDGKPGWSTETRSGVLRSTPGLANRGGAQRMAVEDDESYFDTSDDEDDPPAPKNDTAEKVLKNNIGGSAEKPSTLSLVDYEEDEDESEEAASNSASSAMDGETIVERNAEGSTAKSESLPRTTAADNTSSDVIKDGVGVNEEELSTFKAMPKKVEDEESIQLGAAVKKKSPAMIQINLSIPGSVSNDENKTVHGTASSNGSNEGHTENRVSKRQKI